jgi:multimeric flavodoxin WrbA/putative sterol carrier protein
MKILVISSSPKSGGKSNTELLLNHLARGMREAGGEVRIVKLREKTVRNCLGCFNCWTRTPGRCIQEDDMTQELLPLIPASDLVVYATPLYNRTMNATMSNFRERLLPLSQPFSEKRDGKFVRKLRRKLPPAVWLSVCGHPEESEFEALSQFLSSTHHPDTPIVAEIYRTSSEALKHPVFKKNLCDILEATIEAGRELVRSFEIPKDTLERIKQPLNDPKSLFIIGNLMWQTCIDEHVTLEEFFVKGMKPRPYSLEGFMEISKYGLNKEAAEGKKVILQFRFSGEVDSSCYFTIEKGNIKSTVGTSDSFDIAIDTPFSLWMDIMSGKADGREMFMQGKYQVDGDLAMMLTLFGKNAHQ